MQDTTAWHCFNEAHACKLPKHLSPGFVFRQTFLAAIDFRLKQNLQYSIPTIPPRILTHSPTSILAYAVFYKDDTSPVLYKSKFHELYENYEKHCF